MKQKYKYFFWYDFIPGMYIIFEEIRLNICSKIAVDSKHFYFLSVLNMHNLLNISGVYAI